MPARVVLDRPLRILHLTTASDAGGISRYLLDLCTAMRRAGHEVTIAGGRGAWHDRFASAGLPWIDTSFQGRPIAAWTAARTLGRWLRSHPVDVVHAHYRRPALVGRRLATETRVPLLYTLHLSHIPMSRPWRWLTDMGDHTHAASEDARQWLIDCAAIPPQRITVIPHGVNPDRFPVADAARKSAARSSLGLPPHARVAAYVGRLDTPKNEDWLLDLAAAACDRLPDLRIVMAGGGPHAADLRRRIAREGLADRVLLLGERDPLPIYHAADALLLPSAREGFSLACAEAMSTGLPVLRTRTSGTTETVVESITGRSVPIDRQAFISAAIDFLSDQPALRRMGEAAAKHVRQHLTFDRQFQATVALYRQLAAG